MRTPAAMPSAAYIVSTEVPPYEKNGNVRPMTGSRPTFMKMFMNVWNRNMPATPTARSEENGVDAR